MPTALDGQVQMDVISVSAGRGPARVREDELGHRCAQARLLQARALVVTGDTRTR